VARTDSAVERASRAARQALQQAIGEDMDRMRFKWDTDPHGRPTFGRHRDGYLHARIIVDGTRKVYLHLRYGSWLIDGDSGTLREPEAVLGSELGRTVKFTLSDEAARFTARERAHERHTNPPSDTKSTGQPVPDAGVPA